MTMTMNAPPNDRSTTTGDRTVRSDQGNGRPSGRVLVLDAQKRQGLVTIRSLSQRGLRVTAGSHRRFSIGGWSRYAADRLAHPDPVTDPAVFIASVERELRHHEYDLVVPMTNKTLAALLEHRTRIEAHTILPFAPTDTLITALDKAETIAAARTLGVRHPTTLAPTELDLEKVATEIGYPAVVKHRHGAGGAGVAICETSTELEREYTRIRERHGLPLIQEFIPNGGERGVYTLYNKSSRLCAVTVQHRIRSNPPAGGSSTLRETISDPDLINRADRLLSGLGWEGPAMVEFRIDSRDGEPVLMEINPRFWGSLALSVFADVDFPFQLYQLAVNGDCNSNLDYQVDVRARHVLGDLSHLLAREDKRSALREFSRSADAPCSYDVFSITDPLPGILHTGHEVLQFIGGRS